MHPSSKQVDHLPCAEDDSAILSVEEKLNLFKALGVDPKNPEKHKKYFEDW